MAFSYNLRIVTVMFIGGPSPALVCAVTWNIYTFSDDNPPTVYISTSSLVLVTIKIVELYLSEYSIITPLRVRGGLHFNITELELTPIISNDSGLLGPANKIWFYFAEMSRFFADHVKYIPKITWLQTTRIIVVTNIKITCLLPAKLGRKATITKLC